MLQGNVEGVKLSQCDFVAVQHGVFAEKCLQLNVVNSHINASHGGILARNVNQSSFSNLLIYKVGFHLNLSHRAYRVHMFWLCARLGEYVHEKSLSEVEAETGAHAHADGGARARACAIAHAHARARARAHAHAAEAETRPGW